MIFILIILIFITFILANNFINVELFMDAQTYNASEVGKIRGILTRIYQFIIAIGISICLINLISLENNWMSKIGRKTISIYMLSPFLQEVLYNIVIIILLNVIGNNIITLIICMVLSYIIIWICSLDKVYNKYNKLIDKIYYIVTINNYKNNTKTYD